MSSLHCRRLGIQGNHRDGCGENGDGDPRDLVGDYGAEDASMISILVDYFSLCLSDDKTQISVEGAAPQEYWSDEFMFAFFVTLKSNKVTVLRTHSNCFEWWNWQNVAIFWNRLHWLERLFLEDSNIGVDGCLALTKLLRNERSKLKWFSLSGNHIDDECMSILVDALQFNNVLEILDLEKNAIGIDGCVVLTTLLQNKQSRIKRISLSDNDIDDECAHVLANALKSNAVLEGLNLDGNYAITSNGWKCFLDLVCDDRSIENTYLSNHTLQSLGTGLGRTHSVSREYIKLRRIRQRTGFGPSTPTRRSFLTEDQNIPGRLVEVMEIMNSPVLQEDDFDAHMIGRNKVIFTHLNGEFALDELVGLDVKLMPRLIAWIGLQRGLRGLHRILRDWNVPVLFGFPSFHQVRVRSLEAEIASLLLQNESLRAEVSWVKGEKDAVEKEIDMLRSK